MAIAFCLRHMHATKDTSIIGTGTTNIGTGSIIKPTHKLAHTGKCKKRLIFQFASFEGSSFGSVGVCMDKCLY